MDSAGSTPKLGRLTPTVVWELDANANLVEIYRVPNHRFAAILPFAKPTLALISGAWYSAVPSPEQFEIDEEARRMVRLREAGAEAIELLSNNVTPALPNIALEVEPLPCRQCQTMNEQRDVVDEFWDHWYGRLFLQWEYDYESCPLSVDRFSNEPTPSEAFPKMCASCKVPDDDEPIPRLPEWFFERPVESLSLRWFKRLCNVNRRMDEIQQEITKIVEDRKKKAKVLETQRAMTQA
jgi:hypothetical protein